MTHTADWQLIETAPKDGEDVLLCQDYGDGTFEMVVGAWSDATDEWRSGEPFPHKPTHWMPLPEPPDA
jgi:hypothetical protein